VQLPRTPILGTWMNNAGLHENFQDSPPIHRQFIAAHYYCALGYILFAL
jgi:hypothetical protein